MNYKIKVYRHFEKEVKKLSKRYKSLKQDLTILAAELMQNPDMGTDLGNGLHKVRMSIASKGKGKRGGARVITLIATLSKDCHYNKSPSHRDSWASRIPSSAGKKTQKNIRDLFCPILPGKQQMYLIHISASTGKTLHTNAGVSLNTKQQT